MHPLRPLGQDLVGRRAFWLGALTAAFVSITVAALVRTAAPLFPQHYLTALVAAGVFWTLAFLIFLLNYAPILMKPRVDGRPG